MWRGRKLAKGFILVDGWEGFHLAGLGRYFLGRSGEVIPGARLGMYSHEQGWGRYSLVQGWGGTLLDRAGKFPLVQHYLLYLQGWQHSPFVQGWRRHFLGAMMVKAL